MASDAQHIVIEATHLPSHQIDCDRLQLSQFSWQLHFHSLTTCQLCLSAGQCQVACDAHCMLKLKSCLG